jgi:hypothetical protein
MFYLYGTAEQTAHKVRACCRGGPQVGVGTRVQLTVEGGLESSCQFGEDNGISMRAAV